MNEVCPAPAAATTLRASSERGKENVSSMRRMAGGTFWLGSNEHYPEEGPARQVAVDAFWIDTAPVTNREFQAFVAATGYVTLAEHAPDPNLYPDADPAML